LSSTRLIRVVLKPAAFIASLGPVAWLVWASLTGHLSVDPLADLTNETGLWALRFICITLAVTPLRRVTGWNEIIRFRRMMGLFAFFYGSLHFLIYVIADRFAGLDFPDGFVAWSTVVNLAKSVGEDIYKRPFITIGFTTLMLLLPLAVTSTAGWIRRLGGKKWQALHRLIYAAGLTAILHYWWLVKIDITSPQRYAIVIGVLLTFRLIWIRFRAQTPASARSRPEAQSPKSAA
jgi:methionine sulfoxide reductase heme-binding subunit